MTNTHNEVFSLTHNLANKRLNYAVIQKSYWQYRGTNQKDFERLYRGRVSKRGIIPKGNRNKNLSNLREWSTHKDSHNTISIKLPPNPKLLHKSTILINTTLFQYYFFSFSKFFHPCRVWIDACLWVLVQVFLYGCYCFLFSWTLNFVLLYEFLPCLRK